MKFDKVNDTYSYLLSMAIHSLTKENYEELLKEVQANTEESIRISKLEPVQMYTDDLKELRKKIAK
jgi:cobalamin biosynthesis Co2+ chelatase CbiK